MNIDDFKRDVLDGLSQKVPNFSSQDLYHAYYDVLLLSEETTALERQNPDDTLFNTQACEEDKLLAYRTSRFISVLLKACYMIADVFLTRFLGALHGTESMSMNAFVRKGNARFIPLQTANLLPAYCVATYRNKLVAHYDYKRLGACRTSTTGSRTLNPFPEGFAVDDDEINNLNTLRDKYQLQIPELEGIENAFKLVTALFYLVPVGHVGAINPDRENINTIAERGGCESQSADEIIAALDKLCMGVVECLSNSTSDTTVLGRSV